MNDWTGGYVSDIEYLPGFYREQAPSVLDLTCLMAGVEPPRRPGAEGGFTYCEIGCGHGTTIAALAAACPEGRFYGIDFIPAHIARADSFRRGAGIANLEFLEADVVALADAPDSALPMFDYVTLHGVYSWVSPQVRAGIVRFLGRFLRPGGAVYVSYNALPSWASFLPAQRALYEFAARVPGTSDRRIEAAGDFLRKMIAAGSPAIDRGAFDLIFQTETMTRTPEESRAYLAHEFLNTSWQPLYHMDVSREMAEAKLSFVGSAVLPENFVGVGLSSEAQEIVESLPEGPFRETAKDYFNGRSFRRDVFVRGRRNITTAQRDACLRGVILAQLARIAPGNFEAEVLTSTLELREETYAPIFRALDEGPVTVGALVDRAQASGSSLTATELVGILVGLSKALPVMHDVLSEGVTACYRHNLQVCRDAFTGPRQLRFTIAVPVGHTGQSLSALELAVLDGLLGDVPRDVEALTRHVLDRTGVAEDEIRPGLPPVPDAVARAADADKTLERAAQEAERPMGERVANAVAACLADSVPSWDRLGLCPRDRG